MNADYIELNKRFKEYTGYEIEKIATVAVLPFIQDYASTIVNSEEYSRNDNLRNSDIDMMIQHLNHLVRGKETLSLDMNLWDFAQQLIYDVSHKLGYVWEENCDYFECGVTFKKVNKLDKISSEQKQKIIQEYEMIESILGLLNCTNGMTMETLSKELRKTKNLCKGVFSYRTVSNFISFDLVTISGAIFTIEKKKDETVGMSQNDIRLTENIDLYIEFDGGGTAIQTNIEELRK